MCVKPDNTVFHRSISFISRFLHITAGAVCILIIFLSLFQCSLKQEEGFDASSAAQHNRAVALMGQFNFREAERVFSRLAGEHPQNMDLQINLAISILNRQEEGDDKLAFSVLERVLQSSPDNLRARYNAGLLLLYEGRPAEALKHFRYVAEADPHDAENLYFAGKSLMQLSRYEEALGFFRQVIAEDPYIGGAYYGAIMALRRLDSRDDAIAMMEEFERVRDNPRSRQLEFKYTKMGRKAEVLALGQPAGKPAMKPAGPLFGEVMNFPEYERIGSPIVLGDDKNIRHGITLSDMNGDGHTDVFISGALPLREGSGNAIWLGNDDGEYMIDSNHPLSRVTGVNAALWGDINNDGLTDVYLCRRGPNQLWYQIEKDTWRLFSGSDVVDGGDFDTVDGALFDADHDGDLDLFLLNEDGPNELLNNNRDGTFRALAREYGLEGKGAPSRAVVIADLDTDRDADIIVINRRPPHEVYLNGLFWQYASGRGFSSFISADIIAGVAGDTDADGRTELFTLNSKGRVTQWRRGPDDEWQGVEPGTEEGIDMSGSERLAIEDIDGNGTLDMFVMGDHGWSAFALGVTGLELLYEVKDKVKYQDVSWAVHRSLTGPGILGWIPGESPFLWPPGSGRYAFGAFSLSGMETPESNWRSNRSGIGARLSFRTGSRWTILNTVRNDSGPGQGLQPVTVGLGGEDLIDFVAIDWSDGVYQTEVDLTPGRLRHITETQRQLSSCPVLFAWDGETYRFVSDILGVGGVGYALSPGEYAESRPRESFLFPEDLLHEKDGRLIIKVMEPMEEVAYLDSVRLTAYDLPPGWKMALDERMGINFPLPTGKPVFYRKEVLPSRVLNDRGEDVTSSVIKRDSLAAPPGDLDGRFIGRLMRDHTLTLMFPEPLTVSPGKPVLLADGWVEYPYSQTNFAAWQANADYRAPTVESLSASGRWVTILEQFGYPAGMPRQMSVPLPLPEDTSALRIISNQEIYWDRLSIALAEPCSDVKRYDLEMASADLKQPGFPQRTEAAQRLPVYDFTERKPVSDMRYQEGLYTRTGPVGELLSRRDGAVAIFGPGESVHMEFSSPGIPVTPGWNRVYVLTADGWVKDMDLYTRDGDTVDPLPRYEQGVPHDQVLQQTYNTRFLSGPQ